MHGIAYNNMLNASRLILAETSLGLQPSNLCTADCGLLVTCVQLIMITC